MNNCGATSTQVAERFSPPRDFSKNKTGHIPSITLRGGGGGGGANMKPSPRSEGSMSLSPVPAVTPVTVRSVSVNSRGDGCAPVTNGTSHSPRDLDNGVSESMRPSSPGQRIRSGEASSPEQGTEIGVGSPVLHRSESCTGSHLHQRNGSDGDGSGGTNESAPTSPAKQLNKLKRFLSTLQHLGADISPDIGDSVHALVLALVNNTVSIEEFHDQLHKTTNFPLRPFVVPFLKSSLPILQDELKEQAQLAHMTTSQFLTKNEHILFDIIPSQTSDSPGPRDTVPPRDWRPISALNDNGKRPCPSENGLTNGIHDSDVGRPAKCLRMRSPGTDPVDVTSSVHRDGIFGFGHGVRPIRLQDISTSRLIREQLERERLLQEREQYFSVYSYRRPEVNQERQERREDEFKHLENILQCIAGMVEKCQRALVGLQERSVRGSGDRDDLSITMRRRTLDSLTTSGVGEAGLDIKREILNASFRQADGDHRLDMIRKAEDAVKEVKRQAVNELQKAVAAAEAKANEILAIDRAKMERALDEVRQRTRDEVTSLLGRQEESKENCWNCGRLASETCSGCNEARYCGSFCQHRHWETHHRVCGRTAAVSSLSLVSSVGRTALTSTSSTANISGRHCGDAPTLSSLPPPASNRSGDSSHVPSTISAELLIPIIKQEKL